MRKEYTVTLAVDFIVISGSDKRANNLAHNLKKHIADIDLDTGESDIICIDHVSIESIEG